ATERALGRRVEMAVVHVEIAPAIVPFWQRPGETIADAGSWGVSAAQAVVVGTAAAIAALGPLALLGLLAIALLVLATRWLARRPAPARP
ncbi:MAG: hypothetical protein IT378_15450, partial [Sandaracinaceae bacterium]|nr:hypothetical protein [Sandaracinaceae bacterium]